jgi:hypothetical protein
MSPGPHTRQVLGASPGVSAGPHTRQVFSGLPGRQVFSGLSGRQVFSGLPGRQVFSGLSGNTGANASTLTRVCQLCANGPGIERTVPSRG